MASDNDTSILDNSSFIDDQPLLYGRKKSMGTKLDTLTKLQVFGYSIGHFQNDLTVACWFNYTLYFIQNIVFKGIEHAGQKAGLVLLVGQVVDGLATPLVGYLSDKFPSRWGKRTPWYVFGFIIETIAFAFMFQRFRSDDQGSVLIYYLVCASAYNIGWAAVQVPHMALVPSLTLSRKTRDELNNRRNTFTYIANLYVLIFAFFIFKLMHSSAEVQFKTIALVATGLGVFSCLFFLFTVNENKLVEDCKKIKKQLKGEFYGPIETTTKTNNYKNSYKDGGVSPIKSDESNFTSWEFSENEETGQLRVSQRMRAKTTSSQGDEETVSWTHWFTQKSFYIYGFVYMGVRMLVNVQSSLIIYYIQNVLGIAKGVDLCQEGLPMEFALIPMIIYISSTLTSNYLKPLYEKFGRKDTFSIGAIASICGVAIRMFMGPHNQIIMYPLAIAIGLGQSICLNTGIGLISEVVGSKGGSGAFVFGVYGFLDKIMNGIVLYFAAETRDLNLPENEDYVRIVSCLIPGLAVVVSWILVMMGQAADYDAGDLVMDTKPARDRPNKPDAGLSLQEVL